MTHHRPSFANASASALIRYALGATCLAFVLLPGRMWSEEADSRGYRLAPGDRIAVTVFGQPELSGDVLVDDAGTVTIPLTTPIEVKDLTVVECQRRISERLLSDGILRAVSVSVRVTEPRPLYVMGDVRLPGAYPFRYGSTAQSAVALAGGFGPGEAVRQVAVSDYLVAEERVRQLTLQKRTLLVRKARLEAQRDELASFSPPQLAEIADDNETRDIVESEKAIFLAEGNILRGQIDLLRSQKPRLKEQIDANNEQGTAGKKQLDLIRQQIDRYGNLLKQGLGTQNNDFQYRVLEANQEAAVWRLLSDVSRLQVESGNLDFKIKEVEAAFKRQVATELQQTGDHLNELDITLPAAIRIRDVKRQFAGGAAASDSKHPISITRMRDGRAVVLDAQETTPVEPGDVIDVKNEMTRVLPHDEAAATPPELRPVKTDKARGQANAATRIAR